MSTHRMVVRHAKRTAIFVTGIAVTIAGIAMLALPGPGLLVIVAGLSILAVEFAWAARLRDQAKDRASRTAKAAAQRLRRTPPS